MLGLLYHFNNYMKYLLTVITFFITCSSYSQSRSLDYFIKQALENSPLIKDYNNQNYFKVGQPDFKSIVKNTGKLYQQ